MKIFTCSKCGYEGENCDFHIIYNDTNDEIIDSIECCVNCGNYEDGFIITNW